MLNELVIASSLESTLLNLVGEVNDEGSAWANWKDFKETPVTYAEQYLAS